jgi:hypothetical protein
LISGFSKKVWFAFGILIAICSYLECANSLQKRHADRKKGLFFGFNRRHSYQDLVRKKECHIGARGLTK